MGSLPKSPAARGATERSLPIGGCCEVKPKEGVRGVCCTHVHPTSIGPVRPTSGAKPLLVSRCDIEIGVSATKQLVLSIIGMNCSGCFAKVTRTLEGLNGVSRESVKASFVLNRAQLLYDSNKISGGGNEIASILRKKTGFTCTILSESDEGDTAEAFGGALLLYMTAEVKDRLETGVAGVGKIEAYSGPFSEDTKSRLLATSDKGQLRLWMVRFDPIVIGARDVLSNAGDGTHLFDGEWDQAGEHSAQMHEKRHLNSLLFKFLLCAVLTTPVVVLAFGRFKHIPWIQRNAGALALATVVQGLAYSLYVGAFRSLVFQHEIDMDCLVVLSTTTAYVYSLVVFGVGVQVERVGRPSRLGRREPFFETSTLLLTLILLGRLLTAWVKSRATRSANGIGTLQEREGTLDGGVKLDARLLHYGDILIAEGGDRVVTDGVVIDGEAEIDESLLTGEPEPVVRTAKSNLLAGSLLVNGRIRYRVTRLLNENTIGVMKRLVARAASSRTRSQDISDRIAAYLTPIVLGLSCAIFLIWTLVSLYRLNPKLSATDSCINAVTYAIATLAISCPCAIGLAVPMVLVVGCSLGMKGGVVFKNALAVEKSSKVGHVIFDKTGTLTSGRLKVETARFLFQEDETRLIVARLTARDKHPVSKAIAEYCRRDFDTISLNFAVTSLVGRGLEAAMDGAIVRGGKPAWLGDGIQSHRLVQQVVSDGLTPFAVVVDGALAAIFGLTDAVRAEGKGVIQYLDSRKIKSHLLSGDQQSVVDKVVQQIGIEGIRARGSCTPEDKASYIKGLQSTGEVVLFIGDGSNDAVALTQADVGLSMANSTDIAVGAADIGIISDSLLGLPAFLNLARRMNRIIIFNFGWALTYNLFAILLAGGAFEAVGVRIEPTYAGLGEIVSVFPVILASLTMAWFKLDRLDE